MKIKFISYGHKYYEAEGKSPPEHDFLFSLRDLPNPYWVEELRAFTGLEEPIRNFFEKSDIACKRLDSLRALCLDYVRDFLANETRTSSDSLSFAFRCTGGKHRSVYFSQNIYEHIQASIQDLAPELALVLGTEPASDRISACDLELEHIDLPRYSKLSSGVS